MKISTLVLALTASLSLGVQAQAPTSPSGARTEVPAPPPAPPAPPQINVQQPAQQPTGQAGIGVNVQSQQQLRQTNINSANQASGAFTNQFGTNLTPTGRTNTQFAVTNTFSATNTIIYQDKAASPQDRVLLLSIRQRIGAVPTFEPFAPVVSFLVREGLVTVLGSVPTEQDRVRLITFVRGIPGIVRVYDQLNLGAAGATGNIGVTEGVALSASDRALMMQIRQTIQSEVSISGTVPAAVQVSVQNGAVTVTGTAPSEQAKAQIASAVQNVTGVAQVNNQIQVNAAAQGGAGTPGGTETGGSTNLPPTSTTNPPATP